MKWFAGMWLLAVLCSLSLFAHQVAARPGYSGDMQALAAKERQELAKYAAKMLQILLHDSGNSELPVESKRNSGMLDAVIGMPDLFRAGKK